MEGNYIKISRSILEWEWYTDINTYRLFTHMLLKANWKDGNFRGEEVPRGSFVSSIGKLSEETQLTEREVRTAISHLKTTGEVTSRATNRYTVFTVNNYDLYQSNDKQSDKQETDKRQTNDKLTTTIEEGKKGRRKEGKNISPVEHFEEFTEVYPKKCTGNMVVTEYCNAVLAGVPEVDLIEAARKYALHCQREKTPGQFIKNPENFIRDNTFLKYVEGVEDEPRRDIEPHEKSINDIMAERGIGGEFTGF